MTVEQIDAELAALASQMEKLTSTRRSLEEKRRRLLARQFIVANQITPDDVQMSQIPGVPLFFVSHKFIEWITSQPNKKRFVEWNNVIYFMTDFLQGKLPDMPARVSDLST